MKKLLLLLPLIGAFALAGCGEEEPSGEGGQEEGTNLEYNEAQSKAKVHELINNGGLEVSYKYSANGEEETTLKLGTKNNFYWVESESKSMIEIVDETNFRSYSYDEENNAYTPGDLVPYGDTNEYKESIIAGNTTYFYLAHHVDGTNSFHKVKDTTFVGRSATEYSYQIIASVAEAQQRVIIDKQTGITLLWEASGSTIYGESEAARFEVTEFKTGDQVKVPSIVA